MNLKFKKPILKPHIVSIDQPCPEAYVDESNHFIAIIRDKGQSRFLCDYIHQHKNTLNNIIANSGGIIFRGFITENPSMFGESVAAFGHKPLPYLERAAIRNEVVPGVFTSTEFSSSHWIDLHHEMSFSKKIPERIYFYADTLAETGGETPVADEYRVTSRISSKILKAFSKHGLLYIRNYQKNIDMDWQSAFQCNDKATVEKYCKQHNIAYEWLSDDHLRTQQHQNAFAFDIVSGRTLFCNHAHLFHGMALNPSLFKALRDEFGDRGLPRNVLFGDGTPIPDDIILEIREIYKDCQRTFPWERHDMMVLNNIRCLHGRAPFTGTRKTLVSLTNIISRSI